MRITVSNTLKKASLVAATALGVMAIAGTASAATYTTNCDGNDCYRLRCDDLGLTCERVDHFYRGEGFAPYRARYVCDEDGYNCGWTRVPLGYVPRDYDENDMYDVPDDY